MAVSKFQQLIHLVFRKIE